MIDQDQMTYLNPGNRDKVIYPALNEIWNELEAEECREGFVNGWPYHAHLVIGGVEIQLYKDEHRRTIGCAGDIMFKNEGYGWEMELA